MQADYSIECGADDECLEIPWASEDSTLRYVDLKKSPKLIAELEEARRYPEIADFLQTVNSTHSAFQTAKCDAGFTHEMTVDDEPFGTSAKFGSYADVLFASRVKTRSFDENEACARHLVRLLRRAPEMPASAEFLVRRCFFAGDREPDGFYMTCYVFGYSDSEEEARKHWGIALCLVGGALVQTSAQQRPV